MQLQWLYRNPAWEEISWQRKLSDTGLEIRAEELLASSARFAAKGEWDHSQDCRGALFLVRDEQRRRRKQL
tara:strand:+ start:4043 stop:4255 length:213 start_codon:yes stop_codon:yes gene_type:complete